MHTPIRTNRASLPQKWDFPAANGEGALHARAWLAEDPAALVQIAHGMSEHGGRYDDFARFLVGQGFSVVANDHAGHGLSAMGHLGAFSSRPGGFDDSVADVHSLFVLADERLGALPHFLLGHSMGSLMAALYAERYQDLAGLILCGMPAGIRASRLFQLLAGIIAAARGQLACSPLLERLSGSAAALSPEDALKARAWLTRDVEIVQEFCDDPLCGFDYTAGGYLAFMRAYHSVNSSKWGHNIPNIPILVTAGTDDTATNSGKGPTEHAAQLVSTGHTQVELKLWEDCRHEILNELNRDEIYVYLQHWLLC